MFERHTEQTHYRDLFLQISFCLSVSAMKVTLVITASAGQISTEQREIYYEDRKEEAEKEGRGERMMSM